MFQIIDNENQFPHLVIDTLLAFDFGEKRIGVAIGHAMLESARALTTISAESNHARFTAIAEIFKTWQPNLFVVGWPSYEDERPHPLQPLIKKFAQRLNGRFACPVCMIDERYSSLEAQALPPARSSLDALAAKVILERFLSSSCKPSSILGQ